MDEATVRVIIDGEDSQGSLGEQRYESQPSPVFERLIVAIDRLIQTLKDSREKRQRGAPSFQTVPPVTPVVPPTPPPVAPPTIPVTPGGQGVTPSSSLVPQQRGELVPSSMTFTAPVQMLLHGPVQILAANGQNLLGAGGGLSVPPPTPPEPPMIGNGPGDALATRKPKIEVLGATANWNRDRRNKQPNEYSKLYGGHEAPSTMTGTPLDIAGAIIGKIKAVMDAITGMTVAAGQFTASMISASDSPTNFVAEQSQNIKSFGDSLGKVSGVAGFVVSQLAVLGEALGAVMQELDGMADRYGKFNPEITQAQAMADIRQQLGDFRRSQQAAPDLVKYIESRAELQQKIEDTKIRILSRIMPAVLKGMNAFEKVLPLLESMAGVIADVANALPGAQDRANQRLDTISSILGELNRPGALELPTNVIRQGYPFTHNVREGGI